MRFVVSLSRIRLTFLLSLNPFWKKNPVPITILFPIAFVHKRAPQLLSSFRLQSHCYQSSTLKRTLPTSQTDTLLVKALMTSQPTGKKAEMPCIFEYISSLSCQCQNCHRTENHNLKFLCLFPSALLSSYLQ